MDKLDKIPNLKKLFLTDDKDCGHLRQRLRSPAAKAFGDGRGQGFSFSHSICTFAHFQICKLEGTYADESCWLSP